MSIDYCSTPHESQTRKYRTLSSWGKISLKWRDIKIPMQGKDVLSLPSGSGKIEDNGVGCWNMRLGNIRTCSVRLKRYKPSPGLFWDVEKVKLKDETVLKYNGIVIQEIDKVKSEVKSQMKTRRDANSRRRARLGDLAPDLIKGIGVKSVDGDGEPQIKAGLVNNKDPSKTREFFYCPKCDKKFRKRWDMRKHVLSHYKQLFYSLLPDKEPLCCPVCQMSCSCRQTLMRHYALGHNKVFQLTDLTPEDLKFTRKKCETPATTTESEENRLKEFISQYSNVVAYSKQE